MRFPVLLLVVTLHGLAIASAQNAPDVLVPPPPPPVRKKSGAPARLPVPSPDEQKRAEKMIRDLFKSEYAKRTAEGSRALAASLLASARGTKDDPAGLYVLLRETGEIATSSGDVETALAAVALMAERFDVDAAGLKADTLERARRTIRTPEAASALIDAYLAEADRAKAGGDFDGALAMLRKAETAARTARSDRQAEIEAVLDGLLETQKQHQELERLKTALEKEPKDPASLKALLDLLIVRMDDPARAKDYADRFEDEKTRKMILLAAQAPGDRAPGDSLALGAWYRALAGEARKPDRPQLLERALSHYQDFLRKDKSEGLERKATERQAAELEAEVDKLRFGAVRDVTGGLLARWGFDDPARPGFETRGKCHGTPSGPGAGWVRDPQRGGVMRFDGSGAHLTLPSHPQAGHTAGSWAFWIKVPAAPPASSWTGQIYLQESSVWIALSTGGIGIDLNSGGGWFDTQGGAALGAIAGKGRITRDEWHHIAFSWNGKAVRCFHNGVLSAEAPTVGPKARNPVDKLGPGTTRAMGSRLSGASTFLNGRIDEFRIYDRALSDAEVMAVFRATNPRRAQ